MESLQEQYYGRWELCAADDCSPTDEQRAVLRELAAEDPRVRLTAMDCNGGISAASNAALAMARGEYVALLDHDDELTPDALFRMAEAISRHPDADFVYSDECKIDDTPARNLFHFIFKPDWSPELMFNAMLTGHLTVYRTATVRAIGGFRSAFDFSQDYDLALRMAEVSARILHVERLLYLWRSIPGSAASGDKGFARESNIAALNDALRRREIPGLALPLPHANCVRIAVPAETTRVSIVIPSDSAPNLRSALRAIREGTGYPNYEVLAVCNRPLAYRLRDEFLDWDALRFVCYDKKYNFSDKCNEGARGATGDIVVFYNDDVFPLQRDWVERLVEYLWIPGVGGVSPKLLHLDGTIQYAGMISGTPGLCGTAYNNVPDGAPDPFLTMHKYVRNVSILSGACCAIRRDVFREVGGFDPVNTPDAHSDLDLSYKLTAAGYRCVYTPYAMLRHVGNHSWGGGRQKSKADIYMLRRWGAHVARDPYFTGSMKQVLYQDFRFDYRIFPGHAEPASPTGGPDVLFVSHELSLTGAPRMLLYAARTVLQAGGFPVVVAPEDGPLRSELMRAGIVTIVDASLRPGHFLFDRFARNFDLAVVSTIALADTVRRFSAIEILRTVWWLHEARGLSGRVARGGGRHGLVAPPRPLQQRLFPRVHPVGDRRRGAALRHPRRGEQSGSGTRLGAADLRRVGHHRATEGAGHLRGGHWPAAARAPPAMPVLHDRHGLGHASRLLACDRGADGRSSRGRVSRFAGPRGAASAHRILRRARLPVPRRAVLPRGHGGRHAFEGAPRQRPCRCARGVRRRLVLRVRRGKRHVPRRPAARRVPAPRRTRGNGQGGAPCVRARTDARGVRPPLHRHGRRADRRAGAR